MTRKANIRFGQFTKPRLSRDGRLMVVTIPFLLKRQGCRKCVVAPANAAPWSPRPARVDNTIVKAVVRAHRWRNLLEANEYGSVRELAKAEKINESYLCRVLRLTLLSPALTEAILGGRQPEGLTLPHLLKSLPLEWAKQEATLRR